MQGLPETEAYPRTITTVSVKIGVKRMMDHWRQIRNTIKDKRLTLRKLPRSLSQGEMVKF